MSFLDFRHGERPDRRTPERVYATIDGEASEDAGLIVLEAVEADWFDGTMPTRPWLASPAEVDLDWHISRVELSADAAGRFCMHGGWADWLELELATEPSGDAVHYINLFAAPDEQRLRSARTVDRDLEERLREAHSMDPLEDATSGELTGVLSALASPEAAAVYDVGQGACNALIAAGVPRLYFDFGGGALSHRATYPSQLQSFCFSAHPPIVLSHWDTDHWAAAQRDTRALAQSWIVPRHGRQLRSNQLAFLISLLTTPGNAVHVWPATLPALTVGSITIERATGTTPNNSGLALLWHEDGGSGRMLFPADARYDDLPSAAGDVTSLVAAHHGGRTRTSFVPTPDGAAHGRLVYSFGDPNHFRHPNPKEEAGHRALWGVGLRTPDLRANLGHVHLYWSSTQPAAAPACHGRHCDLQCCQR